MSAQDRIQARKLKGFRDFLPHQAQVRKHIMDKIWGHARLAGFQPIDTPVVEFAETLLGTGGAETDKEVYRFTDHGDRAVALRFDLTVPFARYVAENYSDLVFPFKKVQIGNAWRGEKPQKGRYREFCQADLDIVGVDSLAADLEVLSCIMKNLDDLVPSAFTMALGHRVILSALIAHCLPGLEEGGAVRTLIALDKLAKIGVPAVKALIVEVPGANAEGADKLLETLLLKNAQGDSDLQALRERLTDPVAQAEIDRLAETVALLRELLPSEKAKVVVDLSIARGLGYYTGIVFETTIDGLDGFGSISSGGRYNGLVSRFSSQELPGIGGSIGVDRLLAALEQMQSSQEQVRRGVFVAVAADAQRAYAFRLVQELRRRGVIADIALKSGKLGNQFKFADKRLYAKVVTVGEDEVKTQTLSLKDLASGQEQRSVAYAAALDLLAAE